MYPRTLIEETREAKSEWNKKIYEHGQNSYWKDPFGFPEKTVEKYPELRDGSFWRNEIIMLEHVCQPGETVPLVCLTPANLPKYGPNFTELFFHYQNVEMSSKMLQSGEWTCSHIKAVLLAVSSRYYVPVHAKSTTIRPFISNVPKKYYVTVIWIGQKQADMCFVVGKPTSHNISICRGNDIYTLVDEKSSDVRVLVPPNVASFFYTVLMREVETSVKLSKFNDSYLYESDNGTVQAYMWYKHSEEVRNLDLKGTICAPADGGGVALDLYNAISGDLYPPAYSLRTKETILETMKRGKDCATLLLSYCFVFLTEEEWTFAKKQKWKIYILDSADLNDPDFEKKNVNLYVLRSKGDTSISLPDKHYSKIAYTENLLSITRPVWLSKGPYLEYWQFMHPEELPIVPTLAIKKQLVLQGYCTRVLSGNVITQNWSEFFQESKSYFAPIGKVVGPNEVITLWSSPRTLCCRVLYRIFQPWVKWKATITLGLYVHDRGPWRYFCFTGDYSRGMFYIDKEPDYGPPYISFSYKEMVITCGDEMLKYKIEKIIFQNVSKDILDLWPSHHSYVLSKLLYLGFFRNSVMKSIEERVTPPLSLANTSSHLEDVYDGGGIDYY
jgi:hypothetical protein